MKYKILAIMTWILLCGFPLAGDAENKLLPNDLSSKPENSRSGVSALTSGVTVPANASTAREQETETITVEQVEKQAEAYLMEHLAENTDQLDIKVRYEGKDLELPKGKYQFIYSLPGGGQRTGRFPFSIRVEVNGSHQMLQATAIISAFQDVVKVRKAVKRGEVLTLDDVETGRVKAVKPILNALSQVEDAVGLEVGQNLESGKVLTFGVLKKPSIINRGDRILLVMERGPIKITVPGIAREKGARGSTIPVENLQTKKVVYGEILDEKTVLVNF